MKPDELKEKIPVEELVFSASKSGGPGGQNVNKVNTRVEVRFNVRLASGLSVAEKDLIFSRLKNKINSEGEMVVYCQSERSQIRNKEKAVEKLFTLIAVALTEDPERKPTLPTLRSKIERLEEKRKRSIIKKLRKEKEQLPENQ